MCDNSNDRRNTIDQNVLVNGTGKKVTRAMILKKNSRPTKPEEAVEPDKRPAYCYTGGVRERDNEPPVFRNNNKKNIIRLFINFLLSFSKKYIFVIPGTITTSVCPSGPRGFWSAKTSKRPRTYLKKNKKNHTRYIFTYYAYHRFHNEPVEKRFSFIYLII